jgi:hypothetical protein
MPRKIKIPSVPKMIRIVFRSRWMGATDDSYALDAKHLENLIKDYGRKCYNKGKQDGYNGDY